MARFAEAAAELTLVIVLLAVVVARKQKENTAQFNALVNPLWPRMVKELDMQRVAKDSWSYRSLERDFNDHVIDPFRPKSNQLDGTTQAAVDTAVKGFIAKWKGPISAAERDAIVQDAFDDFVKQGGNTQVDTLRSSYNDIIRSEAQKYDAREDAIGFLRAIQSNVIEPLVAQMLLWNPDKTFDELFTLNDQKRLFGHLYLRDVRHAIECSGRDGSMPDAAEIKKNALAKVGKFNTALEQQLLLHSKDSRIVYNRGHEYEAFYKYAFQIYQIYEDESSKNETGGKEYTANDIVKYAWDRVQRDNN